MKTLTNTTERVEPILIGGSSRGRTWTFGDVYFDEMAWLNIGRDYLIQLAPYEVRFAREFKLIQEKAEEFHKPIEPIGTSLSDMTISRNKNKSNVYRMKKERYFSYDE